MRCGRDADIDIAAVWLCLECYHVAGSTCAGIGRVPGPVATAGAAGDPEPIDGGAVC